jgi:hypothetical protein
VRARRRLARAGRRIGYVVEEAASQAAQVVVVRDHHEWLRNHGEIAVLLRW